jgi:hypothetical protein
MIYSLLMFFTGGLAIYLSLRKKDKLVEVNS